MSEMRPLTPYLLDVFRDIAEGRIDAIGCGDLDDCGGCTALAVDAAEARELIRFVEWLEKNVTPDPREPTVLDVVEIGV